MKKKLVEYLLYIFMYRNCYIGKVFIYMIFRINDFINYKYFILCEIINVYYKNIVYLFVSVDIIFYKLIYI